MVSLAKTWRVAQLFDTDGKRGKTFTKKLIGKLAKALLLDKSTVYDWCLEQELRGIGITDKKSHELIKNVLKMTSKEKESLLRLLKDEKIDASPSKK